MEEKGDDPHWLVTYLTTVSRETGWSADYILWKLPYALGLGIEHAAAVFNGHERVFTESREAGLGAGVREGFRNDFDAVKARYASTDVQGRG